jgi:hypothetical protein
MEIIPPALTRAFLHINRSGVDNGYFFIDLVTAWSKSWYRYRCRSPKNTSQASDFANDMDTLENRSPNISSILLFVKLWSVHQFKQTCVDDPLPVE